MPQNKSVMEYMRGKLYWAKIFGNPRPNYGGDAREWTFEFEPDENGVATLDDHGIKERLRDRKDKKGYEDRDPFLILKRKEFKTDGTPNDHIRIVDQNNQPWADNKLLGNETIADVKVNIVDYGPGKKKGIYPIAIRIMSHVPYQSNEFAPVAADDPYKKEDTFAADFGLDQSSEMEDVPADQAEAPAVEEKPSKPAKTPIPDGDLDDEIPE